MSEFVTARFPEMEFPRTTDRAAMLQRVHRFIPPNSRGRLREAGQDFGPWRGERELVDRVITRVDRMGVGPKLIVQRERDREMLSIREISSAPDLGAAPEIEEIHGAVWDRFEVRSGGLWLCRFVDGSTSVSRHGYLGPGWKGAAEDIFVLSGGMTALVDVAEFIVARTKARELDAATVIVDQDIWTPGGGWRVYGGRQHFHVHVDVDDGAACKP